jgi:hypothetical protein
MICPVLATRVDEQPEATIASPKLIAAMIIRRYLGDDIARQVFLTCPGRYQ